jgi:uncharacterized protein (TIGR02246 family)
MSDMSDEDEIRALVSTWMSATRAGDVETVLSLMTDDAVFLMPGRPPMRKPELASQARMGASARAPRIEGESEIQEIQIAGSWAFMWTKLAVVATPPDGGEQMRRAGHTLSVLRKEGGNWRLARDANMLAPEPKTPSAGS